MSIINSISSSLQLGSDGIWYSSNFSQVSYPESGNNECFSVEDASFWFGHRNRCIISLVKLFCPQLNGPIVDIGGGNGFVSWGLNQAGFDTILIEPGADGAKNARARGLKNVVCATIEDGNFYSHSFPAVGLFDVVEHLEDDLSFLKSVHQLIEPGGYLYVTVPAYNFLWSYEDVNAGHYRRYNLTEINSLVREAGLHLVFSSYFFRPLPLPIFLARTLLYKLGIAQLRDGDVAIQRDHAVEEGLSRRIITGLLNPEVVNLSKGKPMAFGGSCIVVAKARPRT